jgi:hypothetical protein
MKKALYLDITTNTCRCGNSWTHSRPILRASDGSIGGTPTSREEATLSIAHLVHSVRSFHHCWRCAPVGVGVGWASMPTSVATKPLDELEKGIFS